MKRQIFLQCMSTARIFMAATLIGMLPHAAQAGSCQETTEELLPADESDSPEFGAAVALGSQILVVGAPRADLAGMNSGAAYVYRVIGGISAPRQLLLPDAVGTADLFGASVAISESGSVIAVGAIGDDENGLNAGAVYVFRRSGAVYMYEDKLIGSDSATQDSFGTVLSLYGDALVVGAPTHGQFDSGKAYVFRYSNSTWSEEDILEAADGSESTPWRFGAGVSIYGNDIIAGAPRHWINGADSGRAYVFRKIGNHWNQVATLAPANPSVDSFFGDSVALQAGYAVIGAPEQDNYGSGSGAAYIFHKISTDVWAQEAELFASDPAPFAHFGHAVDLSGSAAIVTGPGDDENGTEAGAGYRFDQIGVNWIETEKFLAPDGDDGDRLGWSAQIAGQTVVLGALWDDSGGADAGATYHFDLVCSETICLGDLNGDDSVNSMDLSILLGDWGAPPPNPSDLNGDGMVNAADLSLLIGHWGDCP